jgi:GNAT superfamily N-acetyltransferase
MENITAAFEHREPSWYGNHYLTDVASALGHDATITSELSVPASTLGRLTVTVFHEKPPTRTIDEVFAERRATSAPPLTSSEATRIDEAIARVEQERVVGGTPFGAPPPVSDATRAEWNAQIEDSLVIDPSRGWGASKVDVPPEHAPLAAPLTHYGKGDPGITYAPDNINSRDVIILYRNDAGTPVAYIRLDSGNHSLRYDTHEPIVPGAVANTHVFVSPAFRRQGIASKLYDWAQEQGWDLRPASGKDVTAMGRAFTERYWKNPAAARTPVAAELPPDATGRMHAVESVIHDAADPTIPPLQTTLRAEADLAATGNDWGQVLWNVYRDTEIGREFPVPRFDHTLEGVDVEFLQGLSALENQLHDINPAYTLKRAPGVSVFLEPAADTTVGGALRFRTKLGNMLDQFGPTSNFQRFWEALTAPRENVRMVREAKQALMNQLIPHGATPKQINLWLERQIEYARVSKIAPGRHTMTLFRGHGALTPGTVEELALGVFSDATIASVGPGNFWKLVDRAGNGYVRAAMSAGYRGEAGALQRAFTKFYTKSQDTTLGVGSRLVGKTFYQIYRFMVDPRWWLMNLMEADILGAMRYGFEATRFRDAHHAMLSAPAAAHGGVGPLTAEGAGLALNRDRSGYISRSFDAAKPQTVLDIINHMPANDPMIRELTQRFGPSKDVWAKEIDRMLYDYDTAGPKATVEEAARAEWSVEERQALEPLLTKVWQRNHETYTSIVNYFHGNNSRANWERVMNSYWLYWPLSYQLKATKWLFDVMTKGAFGYKTNLAGAAAFDQLMQMHKDRMAHDDAYAKIFVDHPVLWAVAQMLVPITPGDLGVSLSRPVRYAGGALGLWGAYAQASDPLTAAANIMVLGPTYTSELLQRVAREFKNAH